MIKSEKKLQLLHRMASLGITEDDLREKFIIGTGRGGQKLQKTASCVHLLHIPTGIITKCQKERSRELNRYYARLRLCEKIEKIKLKKKSQAQQAIEKIRRQKRRRTARAKQKMLEQKHHRAAIKVTRKKISPSED